MRLRQTIETSATGAMKKRGARSEGKGRGGEINESSAQGISSPFKARANAERKGTKDKKEEREKKKEERKKKKREKDRKKEDNGNKKERRNAAPFAGPTQAASPGQKKTPPQGGAPSPKSRRVGKGERRGAINSCRNRRRR